MTVYPPDAAPDADEIEAGRRLFAHECDFVAGVASIDGLPADGLPEIAFAAPLSRCRIVAAALGTDAGLAGATAWAVRSFGLS